MASEDCRVIFLTPTVEGKKHDKKLADESNYALPEGSTLLQDTGFQGFTVDDVSIVQPKKKPKSLYEIFCWFLTRMKLSKQEPT